jgi:uncharacterized membrane protein YjjP (DUF1212 family)
MQRIIIDWLIFLMLAVTAALILEDLLKFTLIVNSLIGFLLGFLLKILSSYLADKIID